MKSDLDNLESSMLNRAYMRSYEAKTIKNYAEMLINSEHLSVRSALACVDEIANELKYVINNNKES